MAVPARAGNCRAAPLRTTMTIARFRYQPAKAVKIEPGLGIADAVAAERLKLLAVLGISGFVLPAAVVAGNLAHDLLFRAGRTPAPLFWPADPVILHRPGTR